jgi:hypothetical protein
MNFSFSLRWLNRILGGKSLRHPAPRRATSPRRGLVLRLEALEDRAVPSTLTVTNLLDSGPGSLRAAVTTANTSAGADTIQFAPGLHGTITLGSELSITEDLTINGPGSTLLAVSGGNLTRVLHASGAATHLELNGLTITHGLESIPAGPALGGGLLNDGATVTLSKMVFADNQAQSTGGYAGGGAIANVGGAHLTASLTSFLGNTANGSSDNYGNGGAVYDDQAAVVAIDHSTFLSNLASGGQTNGGAIGHYTGSQLTLDHCTFTDNQVFALPPGSNTFGLDAAGGAIESDDAGSGFFELGVSGQGQPTMTITHCSFTSNLAHAAPATDGNDGAATQAGAMDVDAGAKATVSDSVFLNNSAIGGDGGAGSAGSDGGGGGRTLGGALLCYSGQLTVSNSLFSGNVSHGGSGGQGGSGGNGGNGAQGDGGAIGNFFGGTVDITHCTLVKNTAQGGAGGAPGSGGVGGNGGVSRGGGLANERASIGTVSQTSITHNQAVGGAAAAGGTAGNGLGGGVFTGRLFNGVVASLDLTSCTISANLVQGGAGGAGGNGGFGRGGGIYNGNTDGTGALDPSTPAPTLNLKGTRVSANQAVGGTAGSGGEVGTGVGGGLYNDTADGAVAKADKHTSIKGNKATTSNNDVFGTLTPA